MQTPPITSRLAGEVRAEMARQGITQQRLAETSDMTVWTLGRRLAGASDFAFGEVVAIADALRVPLAELIARAERLAA